MVVSNFLIGFIEDNMGFFVTSTLAAKLPGCTEYIGFPTGYCFGSLINNQPVISILSYVLARLSNPVSAYNLIVLCGIALNYFFSFRFFKKLFGRFIAVLLATIFLFSPFLAYQSRSHFDLMQFWPVIWFLDTLFFSKSRYKAVFLGFLLTLVTGISNYLGYFTILFSALYVTVVFLQSSKKLATIKRNYGDVIKGALVFVLSLLVFMAPYVKSNYFSPRVRMEENTNDKTLNRPFEDFVTFSSRPWYYLLPSVDNPFFGELSQKFLDRISSGRNYLTQNYFKAEHSASYLGLVNLILAFIGLLSLWISQRFRRGSRISPPTPQTAAKSATPLNLFALLITIIGLIILTMPPSITVNDVTLYTPSYILFKIFPMFRVLARMGVLILFLTLIFTGYGYSALLSGFPADRRTGRKTGPIRSTAGIRKIQIVRVIFLTLLSITEFFIPLKITHVGIPPQVYAYIGATDPLKSPIVVYPYNKTNEALFWMTVYKEPLINPRMYENRATNFVSEDFTNLLKTPRGLEKAQYMGAKYLVYFYVGDGSKSMDFFNSSLLLTRVVTDFKEVDQGERQIGAFVRIVEAGSVISNSAILYKFR